MKEQVRVYFSHLFCCNLMFISHCSLSLFCSEYSVNATVSDTVLVLYCAAQLLGNGRRCTIGALLIALKAGVIFHRLCVSLAKEEFLVIGLALHAAA